jgi:hypothetical protein
MNVNAHELTLRQLDELELLEDAYSMVVLKGPHDGRALLQVSTISNSAVATLGKRFGLRPEAQPQDDGRWRLTAVGACAGGSLRCRVLGPPLLTLDEVVEAARSLGMTVVSPATGEARQQERP